MKRLIWFAPPVLLCALLAWVAQVAREIGRQSQIDETQPAYLILVLGAAEYNGKPSPVFRARLDHTFDLFARKLAPWILTTGGAGGDPRFTEAAVGRAYLSARGVPSESIIIERAGESTAYSTAAAAEIMRRMGLKSAIVVSDGYHIYRVKKMLEFRGLIVYGSPRVSQGHGGLREEWSYVRQAIGYVLWKMGVTV